MFIFVPGAVLFDTMTAATVNEKKSTFDFKLLAAITLMWQAYPIYQFLTKGAIPDIVSAETIVVKLIPICLIFSGIFTFSFDRYLRQVELSLY